MMRLIRQVLFYILVLFSSVTAMAQSDCHERERQDIGLIGGATFYMGDLTDNYSLFRNFSYYAGAMYRYNFTPLYTLRGQAGFGQLRGKSERPDIVAVDEAGNTWAFSRPIAFAEVAAEIGFMPLDVFDLRKKKRWAPFLAGGLGFSILSSENDDPPKDVGTSCAYLLLGVGVKFVPWKRFTVSAEWMMRKTFSDNVDFYEGPSGSTFINKDWIGTLGVSISYRLIQDKPCAAYQRQAPNMSNPLKGSPQ